MRSIGFLTMVIVASTAQAFEVNDLIGTWQSNEKMSLESMEKTADIPEKSRAFFRKGFFGRLIVIVKENESTSYFANEKPEKPVFRKHVIRRVSETEFETTYPDTPPETGDTSIITLQGNCYFEIVSKWKFHEYFCHAN